jgi:uncharacterized protein YbjT (DUF2867 family)
MISQIGIAFTENGWKEVLTRNRFSLPYSKHARACYVDDRDVAEAAALALTGDKLDYGTFELPSPGMVNRIELTAFMSEALSRMVEAAELSFEERAQMAKISNGPVLEGIGTYVCGLR